MDEPATFTVGEALKFGALLFRVASSTRCRYLRDCRGGLLLRCWLSCAPALPRRPCGPIWTCAPKHNGGCPPRLPSCEGVWRDGHPSV